MIVPSGTGQIEQHPALPPYDEGGRPRGQGRAALAIALVVVVSVVAIVAWQNANGPSPVTTVRYVNDTGTRVVVTPCGTRQRCVIEAGASVAGKPPPANAVTSRVVDARTRRIVGCLVYSTGERTVHVSDALAGGATC